MLQHKCVHVSPLSGSFTPRVLAALWSGYSTPNLLIARIKGDSPGFIMDFAEYEKWLGTSAPTGDLSPEHVAMNMSEEIDAIFEHYKAAIPVIKTY